MNCGKKVRLKPTKIITAAMRAQHFRIKPSADFRPPVVNAAEIGHDRSADHDVVEVRDDKVRIVNVDIHGDARKKQAGQAAHGEEADETRCA